MHSRIGMDFMRQSISWRSFHPNGLWVLWYAIDPYMSTEDQTRIVAAESRTDASLRFQSSTPSGDDSSGPMVRVWTSFGRLDTTHEQETGCRTCNADRVVPAGFVHWASCLASDDVHAIAIHSSVDGFDLYSIRFFSQHCRTDPLVPTLSKGRFSKGLDRALLPNKRTAVQKKIQCGSVKNKTGECVC
jgi:hypothetical protein